MFKYVNIFNGELSPFSYSWCSRFAYGIASYRDEDKYYHIDRTFSHVDNIAYSKLTAYDNYGCEIVKRFNGKHTIINLSGDIIVKPQKELCARMGEGLYRTSRGIVNSYGCSVFKGLVDNSTRGNARSCNQGCVNYYDIKEKSWVLRSLSGVLLSKCKSDIYKYSEGCYGYFDESIGDSGSDVFYDLILDKRYVVNDSYLTTMSCLSCGRMDMQSTSTELWGYVDRKMSWVIPAKYYDVKPFYNNYAWVKENENSGWYLIDLSGKRVSKNEYQEVGQYFQSFAGHTTAVYKGYLVIVDMHGGIIKEFKNIHAKYCYELTDQWLKYKVE